jgi:hypothetical protein
MRQARAAAFTCFHWFPLTARGAVLIVATVAALQYLALQQHDRLILAACVGCLFLLVVLALTVFAVGIWLRFSELAFGTGIEAMESVPRATGLILKYVPSIPCLLVDIKWLNCEDVDVTLIPRHDGYHETITPRQRQQRSEVIRQFEVGDLFGLCRVKFQRTFPQSIRIEPFPAARSSISYLHRDQQGDDLAHPNGKPHGDLIEMRHYRPGDPLKLVLWKHYARTRQLLVRQPENSIACLSQTIACFVAGSGDQASAGVARAMMTELAQSGEELLFQADGASSPTECAPEATQQIILSADVRSQGGTVIAAIGKLIGSNAIRHCIAFVPSRPGPWIDRLLAAKSASQLQIDAIIGVDSGDTSHQRRFVPKWALRREDTATPRADDVLTVVEHLAAAGIQTRVIHRRSGQAFSSVALRSLLP